MKLILHNLTIVLVFIFLSNISQNKVMIYVRIRSKAHINF